jgi:uncharacterized OB-fold protein
MAKYCTKCGEELKPEARFCPNCGEKVEEDIQIIQNEEGGLTFIVPEGTTVTISDEKPEK